MAASEEDLLERRDRATRAIGFKSWISELAAADVIREGEYAPIYGIAEDKRFSVTYNFDKYAETIREHARSVEHGEKLIELLLKAEAEWRIDKATHKSARKALSIEKSKSPVTPEIRCGFKFKSGSTCTSFAIPGSPRCEKHGGALLDPITRQSMLMVAYARLIEGSETAVSTLIEVCESSRSDMARVQAAKEILDRAGLTPEVRISVTTEDTSEARIERLQDQLNKTKERLIATHTPDSPAGDAVAKALAEAADQDLVDAEIVDDEPVEKPVEEPEVVSGVLVDPPRVNPSD